MQQFIVFRRKRVTRFKKSTYSEKTMPLGMIQAKNYKNALYAARKQFKSRTIPYGEIFVARI